MFDASKLSYAQGNDCLQTRVRWPRTVMPNIAFYCDWIIWDERHTYVDSTSAPRLIYCRSEINALNFLIRNVLDRVKSDFVLLTSSHDLPMPMGFHRKFDFDWPAILRHRHLRAWFTENRDLVHEKIKAIPLGLPHPDLASWTEEKQTPCVWNEALFATLRSRVNTQKKFKIFGCWYPRVDHSSGTCPAEDNERQLAYAHFINQTEIFDWFQPGLHRLEFIATMEKYQFVLCPHGGGLDPNPKCWEALIAKAIPVVMRNSMTEALEHLPIAVVDDWSEVTPRQLESWRAAYVQRLHGPDLEYLMSNSYFYNRMLECLT